MRKVSMYRGALAIVAVLSLVVYLQSCGGGGGSSPGPSAGITRGVITGFGSVIVNGVEYSTDNNTVRLHVDDGMTDIPGADDNVFRVGMVVELQHGSNDNHATRIEFANNLEGPVSGLAGDSFTVLGIPVVTDNTTNIQLDGGATLADGAIAEVSGLPDNAGVLHATFLEVNPAGSLTEFELKGYVAVNNIAVDNTFTLGLVPNASSTTTVQVDAATVYDLAGGQAALTAGTFVEVKTGSATAPLLATAVEAPGPEMETPNGASMSVEGYPTDIDGTAKTFMLMGIVVDASGAVTYEAPLTGFADINGSAKIEVHGEMSGGVLVATRIGPG